MRQRLLTTALRVFLIIGIAWLREETAPAQILPLSGPAETRPPLPNFQPAERPPGNVLPAIPLPGRSSLDSLFSDVRVFVKDVRIEGNTVLAGEPLDAIAAAYEGRALSFGDLENLRDQLTLAYVQRGYVSSGAVIPDQTIEDGVVTISIVEGKLSAIAATIEGRLREPYVKKRLLPSTTGVVNVRRIENALQLLRQNSRIDTLEAELVPGERAGESVLRLHVIEAPARSAILQLDNYQAVSVGSARGAGSIAHGNLTGRGDALSGAVRVTEGLRALDVNYAVPLNRRDTILSFHADVARSRMTQEPFSALDITSRAETYGLTVLQPVYRTVNSQLDVSIAGQLRRSRSFLLGSGFQFSEDLTEEGIARVSVLRLGQTWVRRSIGQALAVRNTFSNGLNAFGATPASSGGGAGRFFTWLGQIQWAHRLSGLGGAGQVIVRADVQWSDSPLPGLEKFAMGGHATVRGYHENELVRDNGAAGSIETRIPIVDKPAMRIEVAPFFDMGRGWNENSGFPETRTLSSLGAGLRWHLKDSLQAEIYWGHPLEDVIRRGGWNLQDRGIHAGLSWILP